MARADLDHASDEEGQHGEREAEDVEEGESHKGLLCRQLLLRVVQVHQSVGHERCQGNLEE